MATATEGDLADAFASFMKSYFLHINPILHSGTFRGRRLNENRIVVLAALDLCGTLTPGDISAAFSVQKGSLTTVIGSLIEAGLVERRAVASDERSYRLVLTEEGRLTVAQIAEQRNLGFARLFGGMPREALGEAVRGIAALTAYLSTQEVRK